MIEKNHRMYIVWLFLLLLKMESQLKYVLMMGAIVKRIYMQFVMRPMNLNMILITE